MPAVDAAAATTLPADSNQALGLARFAIDFFNGRLGEPDEAVLDRVRLFYADAATCGVSAIALRTNAPTVLRDEARTYGAPAGEAGSTIYGDATPLRPEKSVVANCAAVREWDANGTNFGYRPELGATAGEFGHNDFYDVALAAAQIRGLDGAAALRGMLLLDEIRGRLAEVFSLKSYKIDHVVHGAIASAATFGAMMGATAEQIESAIGMVVAHYIPWRAIRAGKQLSDSKGASAAISAEVATLSTLRSMRGFVGPRDIFRNPEAIFRYFEPTTSGAERWKEVAPSPFDLVLTHSGSDFAVMGMHFKLGLYEHQSAGALQALIDLLVEHPHLLADRDGGAIERIRILAYEPAFGIIGNPAKMDPQTRQSADHSMAYIVARTLAKALDHAHEHGGALPTGGGAHDEAWKALMLTPWDYAQQAIHDSRTRALMRKIAFEHGGPEYDQKYPDGIPTSMVVTDNEGRSFDSGLVMHPAGHARNTTADLQDILRNKMRTLASLASDEPDALVERFERVHEASPSALRAIHDFPIRFDESYR